jgi:peroxin-2
VQNDAPTRRQRVLSLLLVVAVPWTWTRLRELAADWSLEDWRGQVLERADRAWRVLSTAHLLVFIYNGKYKSLADRLSGMRLVQAQNEAVRSVSLDFINQQLFFDGFTELLVCLLPLIDFAWLQRLASRLYRRFRLVALRVVSRQPLQDVHDSACVSCGLDPAVMRHVSSCGHSWCYWCIKVDQTGVCPACGEYITDAHRG